MNSTVKEIYIQGKQILTKAGLESPAFEALCILKKVFGIGDRAQLAIHGNEMADDSLAHEYIELINRRLKTPLQYVLGRWEFDGMELHVGEGVLVPREDTLTIINAVQESMNGIEHPTILDLCAGTGAIGLSLARRTDAASVTCVEKSDDALVYLNKNITAFGDGRVFAVKGDVLFSPEFIQNEGANKFDCIVSNPPYIPSRSIDGLQWEVQCEPRMALDGGDDGLDFYRAICNKWLGLLKPGGIIALETGYDTAAGAESIMRHCGIDHIRLFKDFSGIDRCIIGTPVA